MQKQTIYKNADAIILVIVGIFNLTRGVIFNVDSFSYIDAEPHRPFMYPMIIDIYQSLVSESDFFILIIIQMIIGMLGILYISRRFRQHFGLNYASHLVFICILLLPYIVGYGNAIMTEAFGLPLFYIGFEFLIRGLKSKRVSHFLWFFVAVALLITFRRQFLFIYPAFCAIFLYIAVFLRDEYKHKVLIFSLFIISILVTNLAERTYSWFKYDRFGTIPALGEQLSVAPIYISKASDNVAFDNELEKSVFDQAHALLRKTNALAYEVDEKADAAAGYLNLDDSTVFTEKEKQEMVEKINAVMSEPINRYVKVYRVISKRALKWTMEAHDITDPFERDRVSTNIALTLIKNNPTGFISFYISHLTYNQGGYIITLLYIAGIIFCAYYYLKSRNGFVLIVLAVLLFDTANFALVALVEPILWRYSMYTDALIYVTLLSFVLKISAHRKRQMQESSKK